MYQDGVQLASTFAFTGPLFDSTALFAIGANSSWNSTHFDGLIDEVRIYNTALTQSEVQSAMSSPIPEPGRAMLAMTGMIAALFFRRRR